ncbi:MULTISPECIES: ribose 5-phosphate isomerase A [Clostridium]|uniref:ribose 5-phosphate isomerase A n=1 Tax=Clostridium TaxID=1485 RepID=UPI00069EDE01|nr:MULTISPECIES: ribose 5-phosphate isomerase A [Clostridium]KOF58181.1 ribose 5-phosphate isomerase [Clostridium sp. DMHC 10]MCD2348654.1 ribose 5-phosphate isomerase A [Clostridium guangxiense]
MNSSELKKNCAKEALKYIKNNSIIGLGGGSTISYLIDYIKENKNLKVKVVTPSFKTKMLCMKNEVEVLHTCSVSKIDVAFDGCDEVDESFNALKSGGGIHTKEKLIANMADEYILLVDDTKFVKSLTFKYPVVLEILEDSLKYVESLVAELGGKPKVRTSAAKDGYTISDNGNLLMDVMFKSVTDVYKLENSLKNICGVIDTSLFTNVVTKVLVASDSGVKLISTDKKIFKASSKK